MLYKQEKNGLEPGELICQRKTLFMSKVLGSNNGNAPSHVHNPAVKPRGGEHSLKPAVPHALVCTVTSRLSFSVYLMVWYGRV